MAKQLNSITLRISDSPDTSGSPDYVLVEYQIVDSDDNALSKRRSYNYETPDFTDTVETLWSDVVADINIREGLS